MNPLISLPLAVLPAGGLVHLLIGLLCLAIIVYVVVLILDLIPLPQPIRTIVSLILGIILLVALLNYVGIF